MKETSQDDDLLSRKKTDSDSIVRGILNNSMKYTQEKPTGLFFVCTFVKFILRSSR